MKIYFPAIIIAAILFIGCKEPDMGCLAGEYESVKFSKLRMGWDYLTKGKTHTFGNSLTLNEDSTYNFTTCGNITTGNWSTNEDTLLLFAKTNRWRNDSLHEHGFEGRQPRLGDPNIPEKFLRSGDRLSLIDDNIIVIMEKRAK